MIDVVCIEHDGVYFEQRYSVRDAVDDPDRFCCPFSRLEEDAVACVYEGSRKLRPCKTWFNWEKEFLDKS